jgi:hypothetical protein
MSECGKADSFLTPLHSLLFHALRPVLPVAFAAGDRSL